MSLSGIPVFPGTVRSAVLPALSRTRRASWMLSGWFETADLGFEGGGTTCLTLGCADNFVAVRLGFANVSDTPWRISRVIGRASSSFNDYVTPTGDARWTSFTARNADPGTLEVVDAADGPHQIEVRGMEQSGLTQSAKLNWSWTDWAPIRSVEPDPRTGLRVLMLRALIPSNQRITFANSQFRRFTGDPEVNLGHDLFIGGLKFDLDDVTNPADQPPRTTETWVDNQLATGTLFHMVQFLTERPGVSGVAVGDSHAQGTSTIDQFRNYTFCATAGLNRDHRDRIGFSMVNCGVGGLGSEEFFARFYMLLDAVRPSYAVLPGWTFNDRNGDARADHVAMDIFFARLVAAVETCRERGVLPIVLTPLPRNAEAMSPVQLEPWRALREKLLGWPGPSPVVVDATPLVGRSEHNEFDGTYLPSMSDDGMHPNDAGHAAIGEALSAIIKTRL